jgi:hypothetical protein
MVSIDTIMPHNGPVRIGDRTFAGIGAVPLTVWAKVFVASCVRVWSNNAPGGIFDI